MKCVTCGRFGHFSALCETVPTPRKGQDNGGIKCLDDVKDRCRIDESGCWNWAGAASSSAGKTKVPVAWLPEAGRVVSVLRIVWDYYNSAPLGKRIAWRKCGNEACVNPQHLMAGTRQQWGQWAKKQGILGNHLHREDRRAQRIKHGHTALTMELAQWVRESDQPGLHLAHAIGVSSTQISRVRLGRTWVAPANSVFGWRP
jgi:hypothetical protein